MWRGRGSRRSREGGNEPPVGRCGQVVGDTGGLNNDPWAVVLGSDKRGIYTLHSRLKERLRMVSYAKALKTLLL